MPNRSKFCDVAPMLAVADVKATAQFYEEKLGFETEFMVDDPTLPKYALVNRDGFFVHFIEGSVEAAPGSKGGINISVEDVDELFSEFEDQDVFGKDFPTAYDAIREHAPEDKFYGRRDFIMVDPNGYVLVFGKMLDEQDD